MFIEKLNQYTEEQIIGLKNEDNQLRLLIKECPDVCKLKLLASTLIKQTTEVTLVLSSNNNNLIAFSDFECMSDNVSRLLLLNRNEVLNSIDGISIFKNLKELSITDLYSNKINLSELELIDNLEELYLLYNNLSKAHHKVLGNLNGLQKLTVKGLDIQLLDCLPNLEYLRCYGLKTGDNINVKMPKLKHLTIYRSPQIQSLNFLSSLENIVSISLDGLSQIEEMPDLHNLHSLTVMSLANMKRLQSFPLYHENLKDLLLQLPINALNDITPENLPNLKSINVNLGSDGRNEMLLSRFRGFCEVGVWRPLQNSVQQN